MKTKMKNHDSMFERFVLTSIVIRTLIIWFVRQIKIYLYILVVQNSQLSLVAHNATIYRVKY